MRFQLLLLATAASLAGQTITPIPAPGSVLSVLPQTPIAPTNSVQAGDVVFPHFAFGGGWNTTLVMVNMSPQTVTFQYFVSQSGTPLSVTFMTIPGGQLITTTTAHGTLPPNSSFNILLFDPGTPNVQIGWSFLNYDSVNTRIGGYAIFQQRGSLGVYEALVPLSSMNDYKFYLPFDNRSGLRRWLSPTRTPRRLQ